ncbi:hypothetical protein Tco_0099110 [Tanacetum coccineum]
MAVLLPREVIILLAVHWEHSSRVDIKTLRTWGVTDPQHTHTITQPSTSQPKKTQKPRKPKKNTEVPQPSGSAEHVADEAINEEMDDSLVRAATTASSLKAGSGPRRQDTMGDTIAQTRFENVSKTSNDSLLAGVNTPRSDEDSMKLKELMEFCTKLQQRVLDLENTKTAQAQEITSLKLRVKKLEKKGGSRTHKLKRLYKVGRSARVISSDEASLGQDMAEKEVNVAEKEVSIADLVNTAGEVVTTASVEISTAKPTETTFTNDLTLAQTLLEIISKAIMEEPEKPTKRKDQIKHDEEVAQRLQAQLQAELEEEDRYKQNHMKNKSFDDVQKLFDKAMKRVNTFVDMDTELVEGSEVRAEGSKTRAEGSSKRTGEYLQQESTKKQKVDEDKETAEL